MTGASSKVNNRGLLVGESVFPLHDDLLNAPERVIGVAAGEMAVAGPDATIAPWIRNGEGSSGLDHERGPYCAELAAAIAAATAAGAVVRKFYDAATARTYDKADGSPVTDADLAADRVIRDILSQHFPADPILSEEGLDDERRLASDRCWILDPVDGTEQFILRTGEFDILVAFVLAGRPVAVAGHQPATGILVTATAGGGAWVRSPNGNVQRLAFEPAPDPPRLVTSKWFGAPENEAIVQAIADRLGVGPGQPKVTGFSPRLFLTPRSLDVMVGIRPGQDQTMASEWDFAASDLVFHEAGGMVTDLAGRLFQYNKPIPRNNGGLIAAVDPATHARVAEAVRSRRD